MKKIILTSLVLAALIGCKSSVERVRTRNCKNLQKLSVGLTKDKALKLMGRTKGGGYLGVPTIPSPYKTQILEASQKTYEVFYYFTDVNNPFYVAHPAEIEDDQLTPLIFENDILIGWGPDFLNSQIQALSLIPK